jgi:uncharacterized membrane protein YdfJ with MMPL/SSD domain
LRVDAETHGTAEKIDPAKPREIDAQRKALGTEKIKAENEAASHNREHAEKKAEIAAVAFLSIFLFCVFRSKMVRYPA